MNTTRFLLGIFLCFFAVSSVSAATNLPNWKDTTLQVLYSKNTSEMKIVAKLNNVGYLSDSYYIMNLDVGGKLFQQTLQYDSVQNILSANFINYTKVLNQTYPLSFTIKGSRSTTEILYSYTGALVFNGNIGSISGMTGTGNTSTGTTSTGSYISQDEKDAQKIASIIISTIPTSISTTLGKISYLEKVIVSLRGYIVRYPTRKGALDGAISKLQIQIALYKNLTTKIKFIPKYTSPAQEPNVINGIGNSKNKSSWRVD